MANNDADNDEDIASVDTDPRSRLMEAIREGCSFEHISYLVEKFDIDVSAFQDLYLAHATEYASYNAIWWLEKNLNFDFGRLENGRGVMEMIASSPNALRFLKKLHSTEENNRNNREAREALQLFELLRDSGGSKEERRRHLFLTLLVRNNNTAALDYSLSPDGFGWWFSNGLGDIWSLSQLVEEAKSSKTTFRQHEVAGKAGEPLTGQ